MEVFEVVRTVLAVRKYQDKPVPPEVIRQIAESAQLTASSMNQQPWHFIVVEDREMLRKLGGLLKTGPYVAQAGLAVVVAIEDTPYSVSDASRAIQSMILTAWDHGVASNWAGFLGGLNQVKPLLGIPDGMKVLAVVPFGYPAQATGKGEKNRKPLGAVVSLNKYGQPFQE